MARWLLERDGPELPADSKSIDARDLACFPDKASVREAGSIGYFQLLAEREKEFALARAKRWESKENIPALLGEIRDLIALPPAAEFPPVEAAADGGFEKSDAQWTRLTIRTEPGIDLPAVLAMPEGPVKGGMLYADDAKCDAMCDNSRLTQSWLDRGYAILSVELRGFGSTAAIPWRYNRDFIVESHGPNLPDVFIALMLGRSFVGFRAFDLLQSARALAAKLPAGTPLHLEARGQAVVPALHAAALEPGVFRTVRFSDGLQDWRHICQSVVADGAQLQFENVVQGALKAYDLPDLYRLVEERAAKPDAQPE
ncbi:MAG: hypothetical protein BWZ10_02600 [candidate division BRC1 bacterium ADurb.BinA364]|nr:MAG: hypothetical protein BWZ10_02600 [candidate division BRC1 bacterium ADurb.BinA364]